MFPVSAVPLSLSPVSEQPLQTLNDPALGVAGDVYMEDVHIGNIAYNYLARGAGETSDLQYPDWLGYSPMHEDTYATMGYFSPTSPSDGYATSPSTVYVLTLICSPEPPNISH